MPHAHLYRHFTSCKFEMSQPPTFSGPLKRKGFFFGIPQPCFCELVDHVMLVKKNQEAPRAEKQIAITPETRIDVIDDKNMKFAVKNEGEQDNVFIADNPEQAMSWVIALRAATFDNKVPLTMDSFDILSTIGRGSYGKVMLVQRKTDQRLFAIKTIRKAILVQSHKVHTVFNERNILVKAKHPFIVELLSAFQTEAKFYLVLEYVPGGELFTYVKKRRTLPLVEARLYIAEIGLALEYLHKLGIIYRDLKTENILLGEDGHVKLTDFGLSKDLSFMGVTTSFCGTNEYLAPEIIRREQYSFMVDWWTLGILTFEILYGTTPFSNANRARMFQAITSATPRFPPGADPTVVDFISKLLDKNPKRRAKFSDLQGHAFWDGMNFEDVLEKKISPLYVPVIKEKEPTNFDPEFTAEPAADSVASPVNEGSTDFTGFSYNNMVEVDESV